MQKKRKKKNKSKTGDVKILSKSLDSLEVCLLAMKKNRKFKDGREYVEAFLDEINKSRTKLEKKIEEHLKEEKKRLKYHFIHLEKFLKEISR